ncbi:MAG: pilus assembly protein TadG-related protein [Acidobacteriota bacterium]
MRETEMNIKRIRRVSPEAVRRVRRSGDGFFLARLALADEGGQVLPWVVVMMLTILGVAALVVDCGRAMVNQRQLQATTDAMALAAASNISGTSTAYTNYATQYGNSNYSNLNAKYTTTPLCLSTVSGWNIPCTVNSKGVVTVPNAIRVVGTASLPTVFAGVLGKSSVNMSATSTATNSRPVPYNVALIVDSTLSMATPDSNCSNLTGEECALQGVRQLLAGLSTYYDHIALFTFPNVAQGSSPAGIVGSGGKFLCTTLPVPSSQGGVRYSGSSRGTYGYYPMLYEGYGSYQPPYSGIAWDMPYSFPPIPKDTSGYVLGTGNLAPTYQITPFAEDYNDGSGNLTSTSNLVMASSGVSGCTGIAPGSYDGDYGTYYAGAIYAAQAALLKEQASHPNSANVMIILGDGDSNSPPSSSRSVPDSNSPGMPANVTESETTYKSAWAETTKGAYTMGTGYLTLQSGTTYPSYNGECGQAVDAATYVKTYSSGGVSNGTKVYTVAYGASTSGCSTDTSTSSHKGITPCQTLQAMATDGTAGNPSDYFFSDANSTNSGCTADSENSGTTAISQIYLKILASLVKARLIPNSTT